MTPKTVMTSLLLCFIGFTGSAAYAGELLIGGKVGVISPEFDNNVSTDVFPAATLGIGYEFLDLIAVDIAAELEYTNSLSDGSIGNFDHSYESLGLIFSLRTAGPIYFIGRAGYIDQEFDFTGTAPPATDFSPKDSALMAGVGIGFSTGLRWEIQLDNLSYQNDDNVVNNEGSAYYLNIGLSF